MVRYRVRLKRFHLNGDTIELCRRNQKLDLHYSIIDSGRESGVKLLYHTFCVKPRSDSKGKKPKRKKDKAFKRNPSKIIEKKKLFFKPCYQNKD